MFIYVFLKTKKFLLVWQSIVIINNIVNVNFFRSKFYVFVLKFF